MKQLLTLLAIGFFFIACKNEEKKENETMTSAEAEMEESAMAAEEQDSVEIDIEPVSHATAVIHFGDKVIYLDPVGGAQAFEGMDKPDFVLITDIHGDHMDAETLKALNLGETKIIVPQAVKDKLPAELQKNLVVMNNGEKQDQQGINIEAIPMYNLPDSDDAYHTKGRGNGYLLEQDGQRLYIAGDTEDIPEMRNLTDIDIALVPMNLPYTMPVEQAAEGVLTFAPHRVIPYHYRSQDGFSDVDKFKKLVNEKNPDIEVDLMEWYPEKQNQ